MNIRSDRTNHFVEVATDGQFSDRRRTLTYRVPDGLRGALDVGQLIWVPLKQSLALGVVVELHDVPPHGFQAREVHAPVEPEFRLTPTQWRLAVWIAEETVSTLFEAASLMFPPGVSSRAVEYLALNGALDDETLEGLTRVQRRLVELLQKNGEMTLDAARTALDTKLTSVVPALEQQGIVRRLARVRHRPTPQPRPVHRVRLLDGASAPPERAHRQREAFEVLEMRLRTRPDRALPIDVLLGHDEITRPLLRALAERGTIAIEEMPEMAPRRITSRRGSLELTEAQRRVYQTISATRQAEPDCHILLHGVTGSGKTEVYFRTIADILAEGHSAILLVPEIALAGQIIERARARFGEQALILHSALPDHERHANWTRASSGEPLLIIGPRSALFAPLPDIAVIVIDEEHETAYKQDNPPRYHARAVAGKLAELHGATLILGSATPDVETQYRTGGDGWKRIELAERVGQRVIDQLGVIRPRAIPLPAVEVIDLRGELREGNQSLFSRTLAGLIDGRLAAGEQSILFLNRRGMSTFVQCRSCGAVSQCPYCDIPLVYHRTTGRMLCHRCGHRAQPPQQCAVCGATNIGYYGAGTQRVEREIAERFPRARILRWDQDALRGNVSHETLLHQVQHGDADIVIGTQMVSKGLDLPNVTLVGVINADTYIHLPDFRAAERTFQMLAQVAGRAGRRAAGGEVVIQTYSPHHYAITSAARHDYAAFYREELAFRRRHGYPPYKRIARLLYRNRNEDDARRTAELLATEIERFLVGNAQFTGIDLLGPAPAFAARVRGLYGWQILLRGDMAPQMLGEIHIPLGWAVDVDPVSLL